MDKVKALFIEESLRRWHFEDLIQSSGLSRERVNHYLKELVKEGFILRAKPRSRMPYYTANLDAPAFRSEKQLYGLSLLTGLFEHLRSIPLIKTAILFGSFARGDWSKSSDIDLFIYGDDAGFDKAGFERKLGREIQVLNYTDSYTMSKELDSKLLPNIVRGFQIKNSLEPFVVSVHA
ncbi:MAG: nucleotidyltransferase domain-containing protein [Nanoarchaeota archaeon]